MQSDSIPATGRLNWSVEQCVADARYVPGHVGRVSTFGSSSEGGNVGGLDGDKVGVSVEFNSCCVSLELLPSPFRIVVDPEKEEEEDLCKRFKLGSVELDDVVEVPSPT